MSEFGKGYAYCLGLFLAHAERMKAYKGNSSMGPDMWFYGAADHLFELEIPAALTEKKRAAIEAWKSSCLNCRLSLSGEPATWNDVEKALQYAKDLLLEWDAICGIPCEKGDYE